MRNAHVLLWFYKPLFVISHRIFRMRTVFLFSVEALLWIISWNAFVTNAHVFPWNDPIFFVICHRIVWMRTVFFFSVEALLWKLITFFCKCMDFMKCFREKHTCDSLKRSVIVGDMSKLARSENCVPFLCRSFALKDNRVLLKCMNFIKFLWEKCTCVTLKSEAVVCYMSKYCNRENSVPFLCRSFNLKDKHVHLKVYEFHEMLLWETHMCYSEIKSHFLWCFNNC